MNWFGLFRKSTPSPNRPPSPPPTPTEPPPTPDAVRKLLFDAVAAGDDSRLESLCQEHQDLLLAHGAGWLEVPEAFRASPEAYEWYGNGLRAIARFCAEKLGRHELLARLNDSVAIPS
jgi:hypothetical protein